MGARLRQKLEKKLKEEEKRANIYSEARKDLLTRQLSNSENFDRAILSLSVACLGFSLAFIKDVIPLVDAKLLFCLYLSWLFFTISILTTLISFLSSQSGIKKQLEYAEKYYIERKNEFFTKKHWTARITDLLNISSGIIFVIAIIFSVVFVYSNIEGGKKMEKPGQKKKVPITEGATIPEMQKIPGDVIKKGAPIPNMQPIPKPPKTNQPGSEDKPTSGGQPSSEGQGGSKPSDSTKNP